MTASVACKSARQLTYEGRPGLAGRHDVAEIGCWVQDETSEQGHLARVELLATFQGVVAGLGGNPRRYLEQAGISPQQLAQPLASIPLPAVGKLLEDTAMGLGCPDLGMRLAESLSMNVAMQPLDKLFCASPTIRDAFTCGVRHIDAFNSGLVMELDEDYKADFGLIHFQLLDGLMLFPQLIEQLLLLTHHSVLFLSAGFAQSRGVRISHLNISSPVVYARRFNTVVKFGQEYDGLLLGRDDLNCRVADCDVERFAVEAKRIDQRFPARKNSMDFKVRQAVLRLLKSSEECSRRNIADLLGLQERTLNRRLARESTSFEHIRDEVRRNLAVRYLSRSDLSLTEVTSRLGYSELAVLSRSCRRWFGAPPRQIRQDLSAERSV